jgi:uncharacterized membrane protein YjjP (DUF1212 family)
MSEQEQIPGIEFGEACDFIIKLGKSAHVYGSTAGRLEVYLTRMTAALGFQGAFRISASEMFCAFQEKEGQPQKMHMEIMPGAGLDLSKLALAAVTKSFLPQLNLVMVILAAIVVLLPGYTISLWRPGFYCRVPRNGDGNRRRGDPGYPHPDPAHDFMR